jgi:Zn-dependent protease with chaperone function
MNDTSNNSIKYTAKLPDESVNVSQEAPLKEFAKLLGGLFIVFFSLYFFLWLSMTLILEHISPKTEKKLQAFFSMGYPYSYATHAKDPKTAYLQSIADDLNRHAKIPYDIKVSILPESMPNAFAFIGGEIMITTGMLKELKNEQELSFVLAHEMGHLKNKDHLKTVGYGLVFAVASALIDSQYLQSLSIPFSLTANKFSRDQEVAADLFAVKLVYSRYKSAASTTSLFQRMKKYDQSTDYTSTHPNFEYRIEKMQKLISKNNYRLDGVIVSLKFTSQDIK